MKWFYRLLLRQTKGIGAAGSGDRLYMLKTMGNCEFLVIQALTISVLIDETIVGLNS